MPDNCDRGGEQPVAWIFVQETMTVDVGPLRLIMWRRVSKPLYPEDLPGLLQATGEGRDRAPRGAAGNED